MPHDTETERGEDSILPSAPNKSTLDRAPDRVARTIGQTRTCNWLCARYLRRTGKKRDEEVPDRCWWCGQRKMSHPWIFTIHAAGFREREKRDLGTARWRWPDTQAGNLVGRLLGAARWGNTLADWVLATGVGLLGPAKQGFGAERVWGNDGWRRIAVV
jgi:hypothetical protein